MSETTCPDPCGLALAILVVLFIRHASRKQVRQQRIPASVGMTVGLRQSANPQVLKLDWGTFRLQCNEPLGRLALTASRDFFTVYPESDFAIDRPHIVVVPLVDSPGEPFRRKTAFAISCRRREWLHVGITHRKHVPMTGEPV